MFNGSNNLVQFVKRVDALRVEPAMIRVRLTFKSLHASKATHLVLSFRRMDLVLQTDVPPILARSEFCNRIIVMEMVENDSKMVVESI